MGHYSIWGLHFTSGTASPAWAQQSSEEFASGRTLGPVYAGRNNSGIGTIQLTAEGAEIFLDILGSSEIPIRATFADLGAAALALGRGDEVGAGLSLLAAIPLVGAAFNGAKWAKRFRKLNDGKLKDFVPIEINTQFDDIVERYADQIRVAEEMAEKGSWPHAPISAVDVDGKKIIIDGHHRFEAAKKVGFDGDIPFQNVPIEQSGYTIEQLRSFSK